ncbi:hypothetical protein NA57DRAFT_53188 [Rhizodiscina lignyota]|uniref:Uncharacterized protein n=1 Tax=Rhizodiscina lignyota TaxID=1504668 RepID=A0A9P4IGB1_9PEZI|nr:hypothetical protein NA57DRAFT_53188 [Rhizodiscina lignyota]
MAPFNAVFDDLDFHNDPTKRLIGPVAQLVLREARSDQAKVPVYRRVVMNWSPLARDLLAGRSRKTDLSNTPKTVIVLPDWTSEVGMRWLVEWMTEKCKAGDRDDRLVTKQQRGDAPKKDGIRELDGDDFVLVLHVHQATRVLRIPPAINFLESWILHYVDKNTLSPSQLLQFWKIFGVPGTAIDHGKLVNLVIGRMARCMIRGEPEWWWDAIESLMLPGKHPELRKKVYEQLEAIQAGASDWIWEKLCPPENI